MRDNRNDIDRAIESPCIQVCQLHTAEGLGYCVGCYRTIEEITYWTRFEPHIKAYIIEQCSNRRNHLHPQMGFKTDEINE